VQVQSILIDQAKGIAVVDGLIPAREYACRVEHDVHAERFMAPLRFAAGEAGLL